MNGTNVATIDQAADSNTWQIGGSRFPLYDGALMSGAYGFGGVGTPGSYATPSVPPIYPQAGQFTPMSNTAAQAPLSPKHSPLPYVVAGAFIAILGLHFLHWREREHEAEEAA